MFNRQRRVPVQRGPLQIFADRLAEHLGIDWECTVLLISDRAIRRYNRVYASKDRPTDVLSFPNHPEAGGEDENYLGDILISVETAERQSAGALENELKVLLLHGLLHLLGYDHETDDGRMARVELQLREELGLS